MTTRIYLSKVVGSGTQEDPWRPAWWDTVPPSSVSRHGVIESRKYYFWIGYIDTNEAQHTALLADPNVRWINHATLNTTWSQLSPEQRSKAAEVVSWLGFEPRAVSDVFATSSKVRDLIFWLLGKACWTGLRAFPE